MNKYLCLLTFILLVGNSCVKIPAEAVTLSDVVGQRIAAIQTAHETLISEYFDNSRSEVDRFMQDKWIPKFLEIYVDSTDIMNMLNNPQVLSKNQKYKMWDELEKTGTYTGEELSDFTKAVNNGLGDSKRGEIMLSFANSAIKYINLQRLSMINKIDDQEALVLKEIRANYNELILLQSTLTAHIKSAHKVVASQDEILKKLGILDQRDKILEDAVNKNKILNSILKESGSVNDLVEKFMNTN